MSKAVNQKTEQETEEASVFSHCTSISNAIQYMRLGLLTVGWVMLELDAPEFFFAHYIA